MLRPASFIRGAGVAAASLVLIVGGALGADAISRGAAAATDGPRLINLASQESAAPGASGQPAASPDVDGRHPEASGSPEPSESAEPGDDRGQDADAHDLNDDHGQDGANHDLNDDHGGATDASDGRGGSPRPSGSPKPLSGSNSGSNAGPNSGSGGSGHGGSNDGSGHH